MHLDANKRIRNVINIHFKEEALLIPLFQQSAQRQSWLSSLQKEKERLEASHSERLESLHLQFNKQMEKMKLEHLQKVRVVHICTEISV